ncbi:MAG: N-acetylglucosamine-6-phosphate deacetylase [Lachnospirales bacterium]
MNAIKNGIIYSRNKFIENHILIFNEKIIDIVSSNEYRKFVGKITNEYDALGNYVLPGFIDQHIHGYEGFDVMDKKALSIVEISKRLVNNGVTSFLPTTLTASNDDLQRVCDIVKNIKLSNNKGAKIIGVHLEGPYINKSKKGAQNEAFINLPDVDFINKNLDIIKIVTIAPEITGSIDLIEEFRDKINFQIGHSDATFMESNGAIKVGAKGFTHTFNAMRGLSHRDLGVVGSCLLSKYAYAEMICDNIHLDKNIYDFMVKNKGLDKLLLITDCIRAGGMIDGAYDLGGLKTVLKNNECRLENGSLAGSVLKMNEAFKNFFENSSIDFIDCVKMVSVNQGKYLGLENEIGEIDKGLYSDLVIMDDECNVKKTFVNGECLYEV